MELSVGVIIIGSLAWDPSETRTSWRKELNLKEAIRLPLPIRYGRKSSEDGDRKGTYSMVFSNNLTTEAKLGKGLVVPLLAPVKTEKEFKCQVDFMARAEGIRDDRLCSDWGVISI